MTTDHKVRVGVDGNEIVTDEQSWDRQCWTVKSKFRVLAAKANALDLSLELIYDADRPENVRFIWVEGAWERCFIEPFTGPKYYKKSNDHVGHKELHDYVHNNYVALQRLVDNDTPTQSWVALLLDLSIREIDCCDEKREIRWRYRRRQVSSDKLPYWVNDGDVVNGPEGVLPSQLVEMWPDGYRVASRYTTGFGPAHMCRKDDESCEHYQ